MTGPARFQRTGELFRAARALPAPHREAYVRAHADDEALALEVLTLLREDADDRGALDRPAMGAPVDFERLTAGPLDGSVPDRIGSYRVIRRLGAGGMGEVYEAEQDSPRRTVALKVLSPGLGAGGGARRLAYEAELLARLQHPGIAQVYEAGVFGVGERAQPYFAMELVRGEAIDRHASRRRLSVAARLELLALVCDAVHHAHERGIVHRDLKPANILVDDGGQPKVLDLGIARATGTDVHVTTMHTAVGQLLGTVPYMSPEQAAGDTSEIDARSDVYALGVVGYELLSGRLPYDVTGRLLHEAVRVIRETEPTRLSLSSRSLAGDIETIVRKALAKEKSDRYQSAAALAADIRRYLHQQPISARRPSAAYEFRKFARRNRSLVGGVAAVFVALLAGMVATGWQAVVTARARDELRRERDTLAAVNAFLNDDLLASADPKRLIGQGQITLIDAIAAASEDLETRFADSPEAEGMIRATIGTAYLNRDRAGEALEHFGRALLLARGAGEGPAVLAARLNNVGMAHYDRDELELAIAHFDEAVGIVERSAGIGARVEAAAYGLRANCRFWLGDLEGANEDAGKALEIARAHMPEGEDVSALLTTISMIERRLGNLDAAVRMMRESAVLYTARHGADHPDALKATYNVGVLLTSAGEFDEAETILTRVLDGRLRTLGADHSDVFLTQGALAQLHFLTGRHGEAEAFGLRAYGSLVEAFGAGHRYSRMTADVLASIFEAQNRTDEARAWAARGVAADLAETEGESGGAVSPRDR